MRVWEMAFGGEANMKPTYCGGQHHFVGRCDFHLATFVNGFLVSTVGEYRPVSDDNTYRPLGLESDDFYETMVFATQDCEDEPQVMSWSELYCERYATPAAANAGHSRVVARYGATG